MKDFEGFIECVNDAAKQLFEDLGDACKELAADISESMTAKYLRPGGIVCCRSDNKKSYAVLLDSEEVVTVEKDGTLKECSLQDFLADHGTDQLRVASQNRISVGAYEIAHCARMELDEERYPNSQSFILHCMGKPGCESVDAAIAERFGAFEWLRYETQESSDKHEIE